jgi:multimeric flavodoxin WrbA
MSKKVVVVSSSFRKNGNSETLANEFIRGAKETGNEVETIYLRDITLNYCRGCFACLKLNHCVIDDDAKELMEKVRTADVLCFATPLYYYAMSGQLKTFLDRMNPIYSAGHNFKEVYLLTAANDTDPEAMDGAIKEVEGWVSCFDGVELKGVVKGNGLNDVGDVFGKSDILNEAYDMGKNV